MGKVTFDYSKAQSFISEHEMESMKAIAENAKETAKIQDSIVHTK